MRKGGREGGRRGKEALRSVEFGKPLEPFERLARHLLEPDDKLGLVDNGVNRFLPELGHVMHELVVSAPNKGKQRGRAGSAERIKKEGKKGKDDALHLERLELGLGREQGLLGHGSRRRNLPLEMLLLSRQFGRLNRCDLEQANADEGGCQRLFGFPADGSRVGEKGGRRERLTFRWLSA